MKIANDTKDFNINFIEVNFGLGNKGTLKQWSYWAGGLYLELRFG